MSRSGFTKWPRALWSQFLAGRRLSFGRNGRANPPPKAHFRAAREDLIDPLLDGPNEESEEKERKRR
jgi:hypothetical protein